MSYRQAPQQRESNISLPPLSQIFTLSSHTPDSSLSLAPLRNQQQGSSQYYNALPYTRRESHHPQSVPTMLSMHGQLPTLLQPAPLQHVGTPLRSHSLPSVPMARANISYSGPSMGPGVGNAPVQTSNAGFKMNDPRMNMDQSRPVQAESSSSAKVKYECSYCGKLFLRPSALKIHVVSHTGEKDFECPDERCRRRFGIRSNLIRHIRLVHQNLQRDVEESDEWHA